MERKIGLLAAVVGLALFAQAATAAVMVRIPLDDLVRNADVVVQGKVVSSQAFMDEKAGRIYTVHQFDVAEYLKGKGESRIEVTTPGGELEEIGQLVPGSARLVVNEEVVLCLEKTATRFVTIGLAQGKFKVERKEDQILLIQDLSGIMISGEKKGAVKKVSDLPLSTLKELIKRIGQ